MALLAYVPVLPSEITHFVAYTVSIIVHMTSWKSRIGGKFHLILGLRVNATCMFVHDMNFGKYEESSADRCVRLFCENRYKYSGKKYFSKIDIKTTIKSRSLNIGTAPSLHSLNGYRFFLHLYASTNAVMRMLVINVDARHGYPAPWCY